VPVDLDIHLVDFEMPRAIMTTKLDVSVNALVQDLDACSLDLVP
jgi:hypothetical protein